jgi:hypothetical protein
MDGRIACSCGVSGPGPVRSGPRWRLNGSLLEASAEIGRYRGSAGTLLRLLKAAPGSVVARRADAAGNLCASHAEEWIQIVSEMPFNPRCIHSRFGDGLGCPSSNREYRDGNHWITAAGGRVAAVSGWRPSWREESDPAAGIQVSVPNQRGSRRAPTVGLAAEPRMIRLMSEPFARIEPV